MRAPCPSVCDVTIQKSEIDRERRIEVTKLLFDLMTGSQSDTVESTLRS